MKSLKELFEHLSSLGVRYVIIDNWDGLPGNPPEEIEVLCDSIQSFKIAAMLSPLGHNLYKFNYGDNGEYQEFRLYEKGKGLFTISFEEELLTHPVKLNKSEINTPQSDKAFWIAVFMSRHYGRISETYRRVMSEAINGRMGIPRQVAGENPNLKFTV